VFKVFAVAAPLIEAEVPTIAPAELIDATSAPVKNPALGVRTDRAPTRAAALLPSAGTTEKRSVADPGAPTNTLIPPVVDDVPPTIRTAPVPAAAAFKFRLEPAAAPMFGVVITQLVVMQ
jgi:hypothetical protein